MPSVSKPLPLQPVSRLKLLMALGATAALGGCAVGPNYTRPAVQLAPFHNAIAAEGFGRPAAPEPPMDSWWVGFNDPMLVTVVQRALDQNLDLAASLARVRQARAAAMGAGAQLLPTADVDASVTSERESLNGSTGSIGRAFPGFQRNSTEYLVGPQASWELDLFGGLRRNAAAARDEMQAAEAEHTGTRISVAADAADAYLQVRGYQARLTVAQQQVETDQRLLDLVRVRYRAEQADGREVAQAEALLKQAAALIQPLRIGLEVQLNRLDVLMGAQPGTYAQELQAASEIPRSPAVLRSDQPVDILRRRPDIIAAERRLAASNERIGTALSEYYPKISLSGAVGYDSLSTGSLFTGDAFQATGVGSVRWRLFDFGKIDAEVRQARGANAESLAVYRATVMKAAEDVEDALVTVVQMQLHEQALEAQLTALTRARDLAVQAYKAGSIPLTDVLDANRELLTLTDSLDETRADTARAAVGAFRAMGGGWAPPASVASR